MKIIIVGAGISGLASALALTKWLPEEPDITVIEVRSQPSSIGGAVGLTPNALRCLHHLGALSLIREESLGTDIDRIELFTIYTGASLGEITFTGSHGNGVGDPTFKGLRIMRADLVQSLTYCVKALDNVKLRYGCKPVQAEESTKGVTLHLADEEVMNADLLIGCDGIHSFVRTSLVDTERKPIYTGIAVVFGFAELQKGANFPWKDTTSRQGRSNSLQQSWKQRTSSHEKAGSHRDRSRKRSRTT